VFSFSFFSACHSAQLFAAAAGSLTRGVIPGGEPVGDLVGLPSRPSVARSYSEDEMRVFVNQPFWGVPELLGHLMISAV